MSEKRRKTPCKRERKASKPRVCLSAEEVEVFESYINNWFSTVIEPIFMEAMEREAERERAARQMRPKAEIIPFPKARE